MRGSGCRVGTEVRVREPSISGREAQVSDTVCNPYTLHPTPYTLHPAPYTPHLRVSVQTPNHNLPQIDTAHPRP